jgi:hypothetical protein
MIIEPHALYEHTYVYHPTSGFVAFGEWKYCTRLLQFLYARALAYIWDGTAFHLITFQSRQEIH